MARSHTCATTRKAKHPNAPSTPAPKPKRKRQSADDDDGPRFETETIENDKERELYRLVSADALEKASRETKAHTPTRFEIDQAKNELAHLTNIPADVIANKVIRRVRCPIAGCGKYPLNSCCELKKHIGAHLPDELLPFKCGHDGCGYIVFQKSNFRTHVATHDRVKKLKCGLPYHSENGEELLCNFVVSTESKLHDHQRGLWDPRHRKAHDNTSASYSSASSPVLLATDTSAYPSPVATCTALAYASSYSAPYSPSIRSTLSSSTRAISLPPVDTPVLASKTLPPIMAYEWSSDWSGGLTGCFSLHPEDRSSFLYFKKAPTQPLYPVNIIVFDSSDLPGLR